jgi:tetratricopeptide (TPR) repeat protein
MKKIRITLLILFLPFVLSAAQENFFAKFGVNMRAYFNTFYNAKVYFNEAQKAYDDEEDKDQLSTKTRSALNKAAIQAETVINKFPNSSYVDDAMFFNSVCQFQLKRYERALSQLEELTLQHPGSPYYFEAKLWISKCYFQMDKKTIAYDLIEQFLSNNSNRAYFSDAYSLMGYLALQENDIDKALDAFLQAADKASDKEPKCNMYLEAIELLIDKGDYEDALKYNDRAGRNIKFDEQRARVQINYIRLHRLLGDIEKANEYIDDGLKDARLAQYWGDILYEQSNIFFTFKKDRDAVIKLRYIVQDPENSFQKNKDSKAWAKAAYRLGEYYLYDENMIDSSKFFFNKAKTKRRQCEEGELADKYLEKIKQLEKINKDMANIVNRSPGLKDSAWVNFELLSDSTASEMMRRIAFLSDTLDADSANIIAIKNMAEGKYHRFEKALAAYMKDSDDYVGQLFSLAGLFLFDLSYPDTALSIFERIENEFYYTSPIPQAMYSQAYVWEHEYGDMAKADSIKLAITEKFPGSEISNYILNRVPEDSLYYYANQQKIFDIEKKYMDAGDYQDGVNALKKLLKSENMDRKNQAFITYKIAWLYDYELSLNQNTQDSTLHYYQMVTRKYPGTPLATRSSHRIAEIETDISDYLAFLAGDSLKAKEADIDSTLLAMNEKEGKRTDNRPQHPLYRRLPSPGRPRPPRL